MADTKISELTADATPTSDDLLITVNDPGGSPANRRVTIANLNAVLNHDTLTNYVANKHIDWTSDQGATNIHAGNIPDLSGTYKVVAADETANVSAATDSAAGKVELAIASEVNTGTDAQRAITPDALAGSNLGTRVLEVVAVDYETAVEIGDGAGYVTVPSSYAGMNLVAVHARVITAGTTGTTDVQIHNLTQTADMLSTKLTIDSTETGSDTAATAAVIDTDNDDVAAYDLLRVDVDAVSTTAPEGLIVVMEFRLP
jgi:hypothetical protein